MYTATNPTFIPWYNPAKREPILQKKILRLIGVTGDCSKIEAETELRKEGHHHAEVHHSFMILKEKQLIRRCGSGRLGKGRKFYCLTENGVKAIIAENKDPGLFWSVAIGFCRQLEENIAIKDEERKLIFDKIFDFFLKYVIGYPELLNFGGILGHLVGVANDCTNKNRLEWLEINRKILEAVAIEPGISLQEIQSKTKGDKTRIKEFLMSHSIGTQLYVSPTYMSEKSGREFKKYLLHSLFSVVSNNRYTLSLIGIVFFLIILQRIKETDFDFTYQEFFFKIAENYRLKLPLILSKIGFLKNHLSSIAAYNFDTILIHRNSGSEMHSSEIERGNKEIFQNIDSASKHAWTLLSKVYSDAIATVYEAKPKGRIKKIPDLLLGKLKELESHLLFMSSIYPLPIVEKLKHELETYGSASPDYNETLRLQEHILKKIEKILATEISFLYFLNLNSDVYRPTQPLTGSQIEGLFSLTMGQLELGGYREWSPRKTLSQILDSDIEIKNFYCPLVSAAIIYQKETLSTMLEITKGCH